MNTINIDNSKIIIDENKIFLIEIDSNHDLVIEVKEDINGKLIICGNNTNYNLVINMGINSNLVVNSINKDTSINVSVNLLDNSSILYNYSVISSIDSNNVFCINHLGQNTKSEFNNNGVNLSNNKLFFQIDGVIPKESINCCNNQYSKIVNIKDGNSKIIPNFIIDNGLVSANHSAYIGSFSDEEMFYIKSRGISENEMYQLLYRSLLLGKMNLEEEKELFNKLLKKWGLYE